MSKKNSKSVKKYIRKQKALIRRKNFGIKNQEELIKKLYSSPHQNELGEKGESKKS